MQNHSSQCAGVSRQLPQLRCQMARVHCTEDSGRSIVNYLILHYCGMGANSWVSVPVLVCVLILAFYILAETAENYFSPVVRRLVGILGMTPSMGGVTLLALGNGAPDIFASLAAIGGDNSRIGLGAILSAGTFVSAFVVGAVALAAAPFSVRPLPFVRDLLFYFLAVCALFMVYLKGEIVLWQAIGMMSFYALFVVVVIFTDQIKGFDAKLSESEGLMAMDIESPSRKVNLLESRKDIKKSPEEINQTPGTGEDQVTAGAILVDVSLPHLKEPSVLESERGCLKGYLCNCWTLVNSRGKELLAYSRVEEVSHRCFVTFSLRGFNPFKDWILASAILTRCNALLPLHLLLFPPIQSATTEFDLPSLYCSRHESSMSCILVATCWKYNLIGWDAFNTIWNQVALKCPNVLEGVLS